MKPEKPEKPIRESETITVKVSFLIEYEPGSSRGREDAVDAAVLELPYKLRGCGRGGLYSVERVGAELQK